MITKSAGRLRWKNHRNEPQEHWLDHAVPHYGQQLVNDVKILLNTMVIFLPVPMVWALNFQTGSRWTLQATTLNGDLGFYEIKPDQMQFFMQVMVMLFIAVLDFGLYGVLNRIGIRSDLRRMVLAAVLTAFAFIAAGVLELRTIHSLSVEQTTGVSQVRLYNSLTNKITITSNVPELNNVCIAPLDFYETSINVRPNRSKRAIIQYDNYNFLSNPIEKDLKEGKVIEFLFQSNNTLTFEENVSTSNKGLARLRIISNDSNYPSLILTQLKNPHNNITAHSIDSNELPPGLYQVIHNHTILTDLDLRPSSVTTLLFNYSPTNGIHSKTITLPSSQSIHMLWMIPQYALIGAAEAIIGVTGLRFAYSEAPQSMKTVLLSCWLLTMSVGNFIAIIVVSLKIFETEVS